MTSSTHGNEPRLTARYNLVSHINFLRQRVAKLENDAQLADFVFEDIGSTQMTLKDLCNSMRDQLERIRNTFLSTLLCDDAVLARELFVIDATLSFLES
jgi:hypothetical protein